MPRPEEPEQPYGHVPTSAIDELLAVAARQNKTVITDVRVPAIAT